jgi:hypothetical protein
MSARNKSDPRHCMASAKFAVYSDNKLLPDTCHAPSETAIMKHHGFFVWLYALAMSLFLGSGLARADDEKFLPIAYSCPINGNGNVEVLRRNGKGDEARVVLSYSDGEPKIATFSLKRLGQENYKEFIKFDPLIHSSQEGRKIFIYGLSIYLDECQKRNGKYTDFEKKIKSNRKILGIE